MIRIFYDKNLKTILIGNSKPIFPLFTSKISQEDLSGGIPRNFSQNLLLKLKLQKRSIGLSCPNSMTIFHKGLQ